MPTTSTPHHWPQVGQYPRRPLRWPAALALACASTAAPAQDRQPYRVDATLLIPSAHGEPLRRPLPPVVYLFASSQRECEQVHAPRVAAERTRQHQQDVTATRGRVVATCTAVAAP